MRQTTSNLNVRIKSAEINVDQTSKLNREVQCPTTNYKQTLIHICTLG